MPTKGKSLESGVSTTKKTTKTTPKSTTSEPAFTAAEFKEWYRGTGSAADKKVAKALRAQLGRAGYHKLEDEAIDNYSSHGHLSMFKRVSGGSATETAKSGVRKNSGRNYHPDGSVTIKTDKTRNNPYIREKNNWEID